MAITIYNMRIVPYTQKDTIKPVYGNTMELTLVLPEPYALGDEYMLGMDYDRTLVPTVRPICAFTNEYTIDNNEITFRLNLNWQRFRDWVSRIKKPTPVWLQMVRKRNEVYTTLLLDDVLALPSIIDGAGTTFPGDPILDLLDRKMDKTEVEGTDGQVLTMGEDGHYAWADLPEISEQEQADWNESDSSEASYIKHKPDLSIYVEKEAGKGLSSNDFTNADKDKLGGIEDNAQVNVQADWDDSDSSGDAYIRNKPALSTVAISGSYADLSNKPDLTAYSLVTETGNKITMSIDDEYDLVVNLLDKNDNVLSTQDIDLPIESMIVDATYANGVLTLTLQNGNTVDVDISDIVSGLVPDSRTVNGHALSSDVTITASDLNLATVATSGSFNDLVDKPVVEQADWDESDSTEASYIKNKPEIPEDGLDYLCFMAGQENSTVKIYGAPTPNNNVSYIEYSFDKVNWEPYTWTTIQYDSGIVLTLSNFGDSVWFRGRAKRYKPSHGTGYNFEMTGKIYASGSIMSLLDPTCKQVDLLPDNINAFQSLFYSCSALITPPKLPSKTTVSNCYESMFSSCTGLTEVPELPPIGEYNNMFEGCTSLVDASKLTLDGTLTTYFPNSNSNMDGRFEEMFQGCTSLAYAPTILSVGLTNMNYARFRNMFNGCSSLKHIKINATEWGNRNNWTSWLSGVSPKGIFECPSALDCSTRDGSHVPAGWTIVRYDAPQSDWNQTDTTEASYILNKPNVEPSIDELIAFFDGIYHEDSSSASESESESDSASGSDTPSGATDPFTITLADPTKTQGIRLYRQITTTNWDMQYSYDGNSWISISWEDGANFSSTIRIGKGYERNKVYLRGNNNTNYVASSDYFVFNTIDQTSATAVKLSGNLYSIFRRTGFEEITDITTIGTYGQYGCYSLFRNTDGGGKYLFNCIDAGDLYMNATTLQSYLCDSMFRGSSITRAPYLPATSVSNYCYNGMFRDCLNLTEISVAFTTWTNATSGWVNGVGSTGTFKCPSGLDTTLTGANYVPSGWTVENI